MTIAKELWVHWLKVAALIQHSLSNALIPFLDDSLRTHANSQTGIYNQLRKCEATRDTTMLFVHYLIRLDWKDSKLNCSPLATTRTAFSQQNVTTSLQKAAEQRTPAPGAFRRRILQLPGDSSELNWIMKQRDTLQQTDILMNVKRGRNEMVWGRGHKS